MKPPRMHTNMTHSTLTPQERRQTIELLHSARCSCVILKDGKPRLFRERGVKDLYRLLTTEPSSLAGAFVADKVVGKAAAALLILGGVGSSMPTSSADRPSTCCKRRGLPSAARSKCPASSTAPGRGGVRSKPGATDSRLPASASPKSNAS